MWQLLFNRRHSRILGNQPLSWFSWRFTSEPVQPKFICHAAANTTHRQSVATQGCDLCQWMISSGWGLKIRRCSGNWWMKMNRLSFPVETMESIWGTHWLWDCFPTNLPSLSISCASFLLSFPAVDCHEKESYVGQGYDLLTNDHLFKNAGANFVALPFVVPQWQNSWSYPETVQLMKLIEGSSI